MPAINVNLPAAQYRITIEPGALERLGELSRQAAPHDRALLVVDNAIAESHGKVAERSLQVAGFDVATVPMTANETLKTLQTVQRIYSVMLAQRLERSSPVIALGGGVVGDVAGFAAATYLRGVPVIQVPTTLLAMVDAAIGGKTGVNTPLPEGGLGKNLVGAFWQPRAVICDPQVLSTLDVRHLRCGLAECIKHGMIGDAGLLIAIEQDAGKLLAHDLDVLTSLIIRSAAVKIGIVQEDERESGRRALLNLGHTFAHAIEPIAELNLHHGEAVAIGLCAAAKTSSLLGVCDDAYVQRVEGIVSAVGLPCRIEKSVPTAQLMHAMMYDKKVVDGKLRLIIPVKPGEARIVENVPQEIVEQAWRQVGAS
jgi:3-dehydroquinate synthase